MVHIHLNDKGRTSKEKDHSFRNLKPKPAYLPHTAPNIDVPCYGRNCDGLPPNPPVVGPVPPDVTVFVDGAFKGVIKLKRGHWGGPYSNLLVFL